jgi:glycosyltransferase involved in cell wall biosynthesis
MEKFKIVCDPNSREFCSTRIIVDQVNNAAKKLDLYSDDGKVVVYDCLGQKFDYNPDAFWVAYELPFPQFITNNCKPKTIIGLSKDNALFAAYGGYPIDKIQYVTLGVNSENWSYIENKKYIKDKFVFTCMCESNTRSGFDILIPAFGEAFQNNQNVLLYIKDREATPIFKQWVKEMSEKYNCNILHDDRHLSNWEDQVKIFEGTDVAININRSHTFGMVNLQGMSCGIPTICQRYSGFTDYTSDISNISLKFDVVKVTQEKIDYLSSIGMKNHLFPINNSTYPFEPFWSEVDKEDLKSKMIFIMENSRKRDNLKIISKLVASWFTWERCAVNMSYVLKNLN